MTEYKMTDEMRKKLTELLGECWHEWIPTTQGNGVVAICKKCDHVSAYKLQRFFDSDADMLAVFRKIRDVGKLSNFDMFCQGIFLEYTGYDNICDMCNEYQNWLFLDNPERACCLAAMFLEEQR